MDNVPDALSSWAWWFFTVVVVAIFVNLVAGILQPTVDTILERFSTAREERGERKREEQEEKVQKLLNDQLSTIELKLRSNELLLRLAVYLSALVGLLAFVSVTETTSILTSIDSFGFSIASLQAIMLIIGASLLIPVLIIGLVQMRQYLKIRSLIKECDHRRNEPDGLEWP